MNLNNTQQCDIPFKHWEISNCLDDKSLNEISKKWKADRKFIPKMKKVLRDNLLKGWNNTVRRALIK